MTTPQPTPSKGSVWPSVKVTVMAILTAVGTIVVEVARDQGVEPRDFILALVIALIGYVVPELNPPRSAVERGD